MARSQAREFLQQWRYLDLDHGLSIWGLSDQGRSLGRPWVSSEQKPPYKYLVFGDYWAFAEGDLLMFDLNQPDTPVVVYLQEPGPGIKYPLIEYLAPTFSLVLWRLVAEWYGLPEHEH